MKYIKPLILLCLLAIFISNCRDYFVNISFTDVESERAKLIDGIESYQSIQEFKELLKKAKYKCDFEEENNASQEGIPPHNIYIISVNNFSNIGYIGNLQNLFFNNRLYSTKFYPQDFEGYISALKKLEKIDPDKTGRIKIGNYTKISLHGGSGREKFIVWSDIRLIEEMLIWYKRYGN